MNFAKNKRFYVNNYGDAVIMSYKNGTLENREFVLPYQKGLTEKQMTRKRGMKP